MKGAVASGHPLTARAAIEIFSLGGNAFDAAVAAGFASVVAEPALTSLGGGGFLLAHIEKSREDILFDFFVNTPGQHIQSDRRPVMEPVEVKFPQCTQIFHTGFASAAVPGMLKGLLHIHKRLCRLPIRDIIAPALSYLEQGVEVSGLQGYILGLLEPIFRSTDYGKKIYTINSRYASTGDKLFNPLLREFFHRIAGNDCDIYSGEPALRLVRAMKRENGLITLDDLASYGVVEREPLRIRYRDREVLTNPPPSFGGLVLALALNLLEGAGRSGISRDSEEFFIMLIELMKELIAFRPAKDNERVSYPFQDDVMAPLIKSYLNSVSEKTFIATRGTTHISIIDEEGNAASMTTSNGSGAGSFIPGTGIMLNNMMGEDDLHPDGFFSSPPGQRVSSMMIPAMVMNEGKVDFVLGSGGSKRIKTAVLQVLLNAIDFKDRLREAVEAPRLHLEDGLVQAEPGIPPGVLDKIGRHYRIKRWDQKNMYFGGVHCVNREMSGWGDSRRGGSFLALR